MNVNQGNSFTVLGITRVAAQKSNAWAKPPSSSRLGSSRTAIPVSPALSCANTASCKPT